MEIIPKRKESTEKYLILYKNKEISVEVRTSYHFIEPITSQRSVTVYDNNTSKTQFISLGSEFPREEVLFMLEREI